MPLRRPRASSTTTPAIGTSLWRVSTVRRHFSDAVGLGLTSCDLDSEPDLRPRGLCPAPPSARTRSPVVPAQPPARVERHHPLVAGIRGQLWPRGASSFLSPSDLVVQERLIVLCGHTALVRLVTRHAPFRPHPGHRHRAQPRTLASVGVWRRARHHQGAHVTRLTFPIISHLPSALNHRKRIFDFSPLSCSTRPSTRLPSPQHLFNFIRFVLA